jgi:hypothetical protein
MADALWFEADAYDFGRKWGRTFEVSFVRQHGMKNGDLQQVHLVAHFSPLVFTRIRSRIRVISCAGRFDRDHPPGCIALCSYAQLSRAASFSGTRSGRTRPTSAT